MYRPFRASGDRLDAAVLDGDERQGLVSVRSLGRAGLRVGAFDASLFTPAFRSRWCSVSGRLPEPADERNYAEAVLDVVGTYRPRAVFLARDATIEVLRRLRAEIEPASVLTLAPEPALEVAISKERTLALAERLGIRVPTSVPIRNFSDAAAAGRLTGFPAVVKPVQSWVRSSPGGQRLSCVIVKDADEAWRAAEYAIRASGRVILQQWVRGRREAVSLFCVEGKVHARFAQVARRMLPPLGGSSVVRESIPLPRDLTEAGEALVIAAGLDGYSEIEFRRDEDGCAFLMEINPRLSASVEVAVRAGVDFPAFLYAWVAGRPVPTVSTYREGVRMRWLGGDIRWLGETLRQRDRPDVPPPSQALRAFARDCFVPHAYDYVMWADLRPAVVAATKFVISGVARRYRRHRTKVTG